MKYINKSKDKKLVSVNRVKKWIKPEGIVDIDKVDVSFLGVNASVIVPLTERMIKRKAKYKKRAVARIARKEARLKLRASKKVEKKISVKSNLKKKAPKKIQKKSQASKVQASPVVDRKRLKETLSGHTKANLVEIGNRVGLELKMQLKKDELVSLILKASKEKGYTKVLKSI